MDGIRKIDSYGWTDLERQKASDISLRQKNQGVINKEGGRERIQKGDG